MLCSVFFLSAVVQAGKDVSYMGIVVVGIGVTGINVYMF